MVADDGATVLTLRGWWRLVFPVQQIVELRGLEFSIEPDFWLRRVTRFPLYSELNGTRFVLHIKRVGKETEWDRWPDNTIPLYFVTNGGQMKREPLFNVPVPPLDMDESFTTESLPPVFVPHGGRVVIGVRYENAPAGFAFDKDQELLTFQFWRADQVFLAVLGSLVSVVFLTGGALANQYGFTPWASQQSGITKSEVRDLVATALAPTATASATPSPIPDTAALPAPAAR